MTVHEIATDPHFDPYDTAMEPGIAATYARQEARGITEPYRPLTSAETAAKLDGFFAKKKPGYRTERIRRVAGGASKEMFLFDLVDATGSDRKGYVLRVDPPRSIAESCRLRESEMVNAIGNTVAVPPAPWVDIDAELFPTSSLIQEMAEGIAHGLDHPQDPDHPGYGGRLRPRLAEQYMDNFAKLHSFDWSQADLPDFQVPDQDPRQAALWQVNWWAHAWRTDAVTPSPAMAAAELWLRENLPETSELVVVHGDFRSTNYLFDPDDGTVNAVLDWECVHIGDFHEDLGETMPEFFGLPGPGGEFYVSGLMNRETFIAEYERHTGRVVDRKILHFYEVLACFKCAGVCLASGLRAARDEQNHQEAFLTLLGSIGHVFEKDLAELILSATE
jgi:aminoglycoside phosphotransferase (APT) family kinase protein